MTTDGVLAGVHRPEGTAPMVSLPLFLEADDEFALWHRRVSLDGWGEIITDAAARMHRDGAERPAGSRLLMLTLRPWLSGQPFRAQALDNALAQVTALENLHTAAAGELAAHARLALG